MPNDSEDAGPSPVDFDTLSPAEHAVAERLRRARRVAAEAAPDITPTIEDLLELAEMIEEAGWKILGEE